MRRILRLYQPLKGEADMRKLKKEIQSQIKAVKGNLDAVLLGLKSSKLEQLVNKLDSTRRRLEHDGDVAMGLALQVLGRVRSVRDSLKRATTTPLKVKVKMKAKPKAKKKAKAPLRRPPTAKKKTASRSQKRH